MITGTVVFAFIIGLMSGLVVMGARAWARDLGLKMSWWKWLLVGIWYLSFNFSVMLAFTMVGEGEDSAGVKLLLFFGIILFILGVGLARLLWKNREKPS